jgi:hypothetical protein
MGFYIRKALKLGPVRLNLSKGGVGVSVGVPGMRLGMNAAGTPYVHAGRHGIYYRQSLKLPRPPHSTRAPAAEDRITRLVEAQVFENPQIHLDAPGPLSPGSPGTFSAIAGPSRFWLIIFPVYIALLLLYRSRMQRAARCQAELAQSLDFSRPETISSASAAVLIQRYPLPEAFRACAHEMVYESALAKVFADNALTDAERESLSRFEHVFKLGPERAREIRTGWFKAQYLAAVADRELSADEERLLNTVREGLAIPEAEIAAEAETIARLARVREIRTAKLEPIPTPAALQSDQVCYFQGPGRILSKKIVSSYQRQGVRVSGIGLVAQKQGTLFITSDRLLFLGDGAVSIPFNQILDLEADLDLNLLTITRDGRKTPIYISTPESMIAAALLDRLASLESAA